MTDLDTFLKMALLAVYNGTEDEEWGPSPEPPALDWEGAFSRFSLWDEIMNINPSWTPKQFNRMWDGFSDKGKTTFVMRLLRNGVPMTKTPPLDDPLYNPEHPPVDGRIPEVVSRFGPATQIRWFRRFMTQLAPGQHLNTFYVNSDKHRGPCCSSCIGEYIDDYQGGGPIADGWCCCMEIK